MALLSYENYTTAAKSWTQIKSNYSGIQKVISPEQVFTLYREQIEWFDKENEAEIYFRANISVWENNLVLIPTPRTVAGDVITYQFT